MGFILCGAILLACHAAAQTSVTVPAVSKDVVIKGDLSDPLWAQSAVIEDLTQVAPSPNQPSPYKTKVHLLLDAHALVIGVECTDPRPSAIRAPTLTRDGDMGGNDSITVVLDTFSDKKTGYETVVNAIGTIQDGLINGGGEVDKSWDGDWTAAAQKNDHGWTCEMRIPLSTLRFKQGSDTWGFNIERNVARDNTRLRWTAISLDYSLNEMSRAGIISGLSKLSKQPPLAFTPYVLAEDADDVSKNHNTLIGRQGLDVSYAITSDLSAIATFNTDFAEAEVDEQQVQLDRFPLFFPEKRRFFLEGSNQFVFGQNLGHYFVPFYSRRIGLFNGSQVPLDEGLKVIGKAEKFNIGALITRMGNAVGADSTTLAASRVSYDFNEHAQLGAIVTNGSPDGTTKNRLFGVDALWHTTEFQKDKTASVGAWYAKTDGDVPAGRRDGWGASLSYPNDLWDIEAGHDEFGDALDPALGFIQRPGEKRSYLSLDYQPRPKHGNIRQWFFQIEPREWKDLRGRVISSRWFLAPINYVTNEGDHYEIDVIPSYEFVSESFEITDGVNIPVGGYPFTRYLLQLEASESRVLAPSEFLEWGRFFDGNLVQWTQQLSWSMNRRTRLRISAEDDYGDMPSGRFHIQTFEPRLDYAIRDNETLSALSQYDSEGKTLGFNVRYRRTIGLGHDVFIIWNRNWQGLGSNLRRFQPVFNGVSIKLTNTFRS